MYFLLDRHQLTELFRPIEAPHLTQQRLEAPDIIHLQIYLF